MERNHREPEKNIIESKIRTYLFVFKITIWGNFSHGSLGKGIQEKQK